MKILCLSDIHHYEGVVESIKNIVRKEKIDVIINAGDFLSEASARKILDQMPVKTFVVYGNWDDRLVSNNTLVRILSNEMEKHNGYYFFGVDERFFDENAIKSAIKDIPPEKLILITHTPPYGILDLVWTGYNIGALPIRNIIDEKKPAVHVFGHVHEAAGVVHTGSNIFINAAIPNTRKGYILKLPELKIKEVRL